MENTNKDETRITLESFYSGPVEELVSCPCVKDPRESINFSLMSKGGRKAVRITDITEHLTIEWVVGDVVGQEDKDCQKIADMFLEAAKHPIEHSLRDENG